MIVTAPLLAQTTVLSVDSNGNVTANASLSAKAGVGGGTYTSGITATGSGTCTLTFTGGTLRACREDATSRAAS
ncbi:MAG TPA: hypothetical protein VMU80_26420 [Bryobacteraceae bacterium]|nr:hypothetical protein [Bryobacteraceae bacterium]